jgi:hypothetical protein
MLERRSGTAPSIPLTLLGAVSLGGCIERMADCSVNGRFGLLT